MEERLFFFKILLQPSDIKQEPKKLVQHVRRPAHHSAEDNEMKDITRGLVLQSCGVLTLQTSSFNMSTSVSVVTKTDPRCDLLHQTTREAAHVSGRVSGVVRQPGSSYNRSGEP